jgi:hypothetical protein
MHLGAKADLGMLLGARDPGLRLVETRKYFLSVVSDR